MFKCLPSFSNSSSVDQIVMFGLKDAGKTTLLYRLKLDWKDITYELGKMETDEDPGYHYEEFSSRILLNYGIWDVPGSMASVWPMFYRYIKVAAVLFVVNGSAPKLNDSKSAADEEKQKWEDQMTNIGRLVDKLLNEDELRTAAFILIVNDHDEGADETAGDVSSETQYPVICDMLKESKFKKQNPRFFSTHMNCSKVNETSAEWRKVLHWIEDNKMSLAK